MKASMQKQLEARLAQSQASRQRKRKTRVPPVVRYGLLPPEKAHIHRDESAAYENEAYAGDDGGDDEGLSNLRAKWW